MNLRIRRRQFGLLALASAATAAIANLPSKTIAQQSSQLIYGVSLSASSSAPQVAANVANTTPEIVLTSLDLTTSKDVSSSTVAATTVSNLSTPIESAVKSVASQPTERITGLSGIVGGKFVNSTVSISKSGNATRLIFTDPKSSNAQNSLKLSGFPNNNSTVESLLSTQDNRLLSVISLNGGTPPFDLATIDSTTGKVTPSASSGLPTLESGRRYSNLAQSSDGTIYATTIGREGATSLVRLDLGSKSISTVVQLSFNNKPLENDLLSLAISPSGQLYALANPNYEGTNSLFTIDLKTGALNLVRQFNVDKIAFPRA